MAHAWTQSTDKSSRSEPRLLQAGTDIDVTPLAPSSIAEGSLLAPKTVGHQRQPFTKSPHRRAAAIADGSPHKPKPSSY
ncbi:MAG: hypothetical protein ACR2P2_14335 [Nakamurella sp.]